MAVLPCVLTYVIAALMPDDAAGGDGRAFLTRGAVSARCACGYRDEPRNILPRSVDFPHFGWTSSASSPERMPKVQPSGEAAPDGSRQATRIRFPGTEAAGASWHSWIETTIGIDPGQTYTFSFSVRGPKGSSIAASSVAGEQDSLISLDGSWQRIHLTAVAKSPQCTLRIGRQASGQVSVVPDTEGDVLLWGPQLVRGGGRVPYLATTGPTPPPHPLRLVAGGQVWEPCSTHASPEVQGTNLLCWSSDLGDRTWKAEGIDLIAGRNAAAPIGLVEAQRIRESRTNAFHGLAQEFRCPAGVPLVATIYARAEGRRHCTLSISNGSMRAEGRFEVPPAGGIPFCIGNGARIEYVGGGWHRLHIATGPCEGGNGRGTLSVSLLDQLAGDRCYEADGKGSMLVWGPQVEVGIEATSYIPTFFVPETRLADEPVKVPSH